MRSDGSIHYSIVVPFYNEQENIPQLYMKLTEVMDSIGDPYEMVFVDDGSKDNSYKVLSEIYEHDRRVNLVRLRRNFGQTAALKAGFDFARGEIVISMDGDLQHDPEEIPRFLEKIEEGYDLVSGWRSHRKDHWLMRRLPSHVANWLMAKLSGIELHDFGTTFKAYRREILAGNSAVWRTAPVYSCACRIYRCADCRSADIESSAQEREIQLRNWANHSRVF